ncbi:PDZ domain-containing protein [Kibdelosporangium aridum]|uniref:PDZ domain-containing protein n=1 Tax=Kibdelosporangium aridum TaxID=2030 RepID=A0A428ZFV1_KIBAR|nr:trypsin-like peptidase domain-containing protein [Kibdelosporangium aridum]RSM86939.1 PDZ domain-containing protein [Kibdelosporangium aridum]
MSQHPEQNPTPEPDRLGPRPLRRPSVDPSQAAVFGRPPGVDSAFANRNGSHPDPALHAAPPPAAALTEAFSRPPENPDVVLQRPPVDQNGDAPVDAPLWSSKEADPWRDPGAGAMIGPPALDKPEAEPKAKAVKDTGQLLSVPELLFGRRVKTSALIILAVVVLVIGGAGGVVGWLIARAGDSLTSDVTLAEVQPNVERPPGSIADIAKRVAPAVVSIEVRRADGQGNAGSGAVIDGKGYIITNDHVIEDAADDPTVKMTAVFTDGKRAQAKLVGRDQKTDLAVLKVEVTNPTVLQFGDSDKVAVGDAVVAVGSPLGLSNTVTEGIVSALHRPRLVGSNAGAPPVAYDAIQTDASINQGNSGGPLINSAGALIGINSFIVAPGEAGGSVGLGFAIPSNYARKIAEALIRDGQVKHPEIGINAVTSVTAETSEGARVANVAENSAAQKAGIREGDIVTKIGDRIVRNAAELTVAVRAHEIGAKVPVVLVRDGRELTIDVVLQSD